MIAESASPLTMPSAMVRPARTHFPPRFEVGARRREADVMDVPSTYSRYRRLFRGFAVVCPAEAVRSPDTARWVRRHGLTVVAYSSSELTLAISAGIDPKRIMMHGDGRTWGPIRCACNAGVRQFVIDSAAQVPVLDHYSRRRQQVLLDIGAEHVDDAIAAICESDRLDLVGLHCRMPAGSTGTPDAHAAAVDAMVSRMAQIRGCRGIVPCSIGLAGPVGVSPRAIATAIDAATETACARWHFPRPRLAFTPQES